MANLYVTELVEDMSLTQTFCLVKDASGFPLEGTIKIGPEEMRYRGRTDRSFDKLLRGVHGSLQRPHTKGLIVVQHDVPSLLERQITQVLDKIGTDIAFDDDGELIITGAGELHLTEGLETLHTKLRVRITSKWGEGLEDIGVNLAGRTVADVEALVSELVQLIADDPDVSSVESPQYAMEGHTLVFKLVVIPLGMSQGFEFNYRLDKRGDT